MEEIRGQIRGLEKIWASPEYGRAVRMLTSLRKRLQAVRTLAALGRILGEKEDYFNRLRDNNPGLYQYFRSLDEELGRDISKTVSLAEFHSRIKLN
jgi:hypothetical protein